jgi:hypothetical protein
MQPFESFAKLTTKDIRKGSVHHRGAKWPAKFDAFGNRFLAETGGWSSIQVSSHHK